MCPLDFEIRRFWDLALRFCPWIVPWPSCVVSSSATCLHWSPPYVPASVAAQVPLVVFRGGQGCQCSSHSCLSGLLLLVALEGTSGGRGSTAPAPPYAHPVYGCLFGGLGARFQDLLTSGIWSKQERKDHINNLEMRAVMTALLVFKTSS